MHNPLTYDCAIIGGGVAGLCLAIQLSRQGHSVILFEKNKYPFHKVCGEYVSNESYDFFIRLGLPLGDWDLPRISRIGISSERGFMLNAPLVMGGFGVSRFKLDHELFLLAKSAGVTALDNTRVTDVRGRTTITNKGCFESRVTIGAFGKSNPVFAKDTTRKPGKNYIGVKYHIRSDLAADRIELHNFNGGYCGLSKIEVDRYCLCYLSRASNLRMNLNSIKRMEEQVLRKNPFLDSIFGTSGFIFESPVTISNIQFDARKTADDRMLYLGDAAGCISPLTGNGMSMAAYSSVMAAELVDRYLRNTITYSELMKKYDWLWNRCFLKRIRRGKQLQYLFGSKNLSHVALTLLDPFTGLKSRIIESTHGKKFRTEAL